MIDDLELPQVQEIETNDLRRLAEHRAPMQDGSILQDLGRRATRIRLYGVASGPDSLDFVGRLDGKFRDGKPLPFVADILTDAGIDQVIIDDLRFEELAGRRERHAYRITLREHQEPVAPAVTPGLDADIAAEAAALVGDIADGLGALPGLMTGLERFPASLGDLLARLREFRTRIEATQP
jgi:hypothetical protein